MCGRFPQNKRPCPYTAALDPDWHPQELDLQPSWNVSPGRDVLVFHDDDQAMSPSCCIGVFALLDRC